MLVIVFKRVSELILKCFPVPDVRHPSHPILREVELRFLRLDFKAAFLGCRDKAVSHGVVIGPELNATVFEGDSKSIVNVIHSRFLVCDGRDCFVLILPGIGLLDFAFSKGGPIVQNHGYLGRS